MSDPVNHPKHYTSHPSGVECITITKHMGFMLGNALKYIWRCDLKKDAVEDLKKAVWYIEQEIKAREAAKAAHEKKMTAIYSAHPVDAPLFSRPFVFGGPGAGKGSPCG